MVNLGYDCGPYDNIPNIFTFESTVESIKSEELEVFKHEIYECDLATFSKVLEHLEDVSRVSGVYEVEIRIRVEDGDTWVVLGWGETGDPAIIRFERDSV